MSTTASETTMKDSVKDMTGNATFERLEKEVGAMKKDLAALADQITGTIGDLAGTAGKQARRGYKQARANAGAAISDVSQRGGAVLDAAQDAATSLEETLEDVVAQRPLATVGLALGLGFLVGMTWRR